ncbi:MarR family winged helix-turn-helix transcriptional regulator [Frigoribacterium faeni]|uniref:MarR family winged helix-turn-helix transcriptional regulator n=1 Tax=Frigoribacterium faeni TaxID=145483 RepID=UPI00141A849B|nr:MarR family transcriptional regulator [Frigoribacterium faeni]NIJ04597.1 DNA-binding MarR family transcriptional regulator [Frigoribacterium faeni]
MPQKIQAARLHASLEAWRITEQRLDRTVSSAGALPRTERDALALVLAAEQTDEPMTPSGLATTLGFSSPAVSNLLHRLQDAGLVVCTPDPSDGRRKIVTTTEAGRDACDTVTSAPHVRRFLMDVPADQAAAVSAFLDGLSSVIAQQQTGAPTSAR